MGQNYKQWLVEAICLHMLSLMLLASIMWCPNEVHLVMREAVKIINCSQDRIKTGQHWKDDGWNSKRLTTN